MKTTQRNGILQGLGYYKYSFKKTEISYNFNKQNQRRKRQNVDNSIQMYFAVQCLLCLIKMTMLTHGSWDTHLTLSQVS